MIKQLPAERPLPHKQEILEHVLADDVRHRRNRWLVPAAAAASIAVIAGGLVLATSGQEGQPIPGPATQSKSGTKQSTQGPADLQVNVGPADRAEAFALALACVEHQGREHQLGAISRPFKVQTWGDPSKTENSVVALNETTGLVYGCVGFPTTKSASGDTVDGFSAWLIGGDPVAAKKRKSVVNTPDATHPAVPTEGAARWDFIDFDRAPESLAGDAWYRVDERVAAIRQRYVIEGKAGPWFVGQAANDYVFVRSWEKTAVLQVGDKVRIETQVLGRDGKLLDAPADLKGGGGLTPSPGTTRVDVGTVVDGANSGLPPRLDFTNR